MTPAQTAFMTADKILHTTAFRLPGELLRAQEAYFAALRAVVLEFQVTA